MTIRFGVGAGLRFNAGGANAGYALGIAEPPVQRVLKQCLQPGDVFYDVGANVGFFTLLGARRVGPQGHVYAIEPVPEIAAAARRNAALNGMAHVTVREAVVGARVGAGELLFSPEPTCGKLASTGARPDTVGSLAVPMVSLDHLVLEERLPPPALVKIDVEGAELEVLSGMRATVAAHAPLVLCELHETNRPVAAALSEWGYWQLTVEAPETPVAEAHWNAHVLAGPPGKRVRRG
jgi:FkbM family methyltransferase